MYRSILVPLDCSPFAEQAAFLAAALAKDPTHSIHLSVVHSNPDWQTNQWRVPAYAKRDAQLRADEESYLSSLATRLAEVTKARIVPQLLEGTVAPALLAHAAYEDVDLIVMSTHGRGGFERVWLGSVTDVVLRHARAPLLVVRPSDPAADDAPIDARGAPTVPFRRVVAAVDGEQLAERALDASLQLPLAQDAEITALRVVQPHDYPVSPFLPHTVGANRSQARKDIQDAEEYLLTLEQRHSGIAIGSRSVSSARPVDAILSLADEVDADLIVLGTHARGGLVRAVLGSVADRVIRRAHVPVFVMPARAHEMEHVEVRETEASQAALHG